MNKLTNIDKRLDNMLSEAITLRKPKKVIKETKQLLREFNAGEILKQLGGNKFIAMTGAKNFGQSQKEKTISFKIGGGAKNGINHIRIKLNGMDTYDIDFIRIRGTKINVVHTQKHVYNDQLQQIFTQYTGMYTHL